MYVHGTPLLSLILYLCTSTSSTKEECGGIRDKTSGVITSPNYPSSYPPEQSCTWYIKTPPGLHIRIDLSFMDIWAHPGYPCSDFLQLAGGRIAQYRRCGYDPFLRHYESGTNEVTVTFQSDGSGEATGFKLSWNVDPRQLSIYLERQAKLIKQIKSSSPTIPTTPNIRTTTTMRTRNGRRHSSTITATQQDTLTPSDHTVPVETGSGYKSFLLNTTEPVSAMSSNKADVDFKFTVLEICVAAVALFVFVALFKEKVCVKCRQTGARNSVQVYTYQDPDLTPAGHQAHPVIITNGSVRRGTTRGSVLSVTTYIDPVKDYIAENDSNEESEKDMYSSYSESPKSNTSDDRHVYDDVIY